MTDTFDEIYAAHFLYVRRFLLRLCSGNEFTADDLTQETFFQAYKSIHKFKGNCRIETWLCSIAHNVFCAFLRKEKKQKFLRKKQAAEESIGYFMQEYNGLEHDITIILNQFPHLAAEVLIYRLFQDIPYAEISGLLGISESSAKVIYHRGRIKLKNILEMEYGYEI